MKRFIPSFVTLVGLALGLGALGRGAPLLLVPSLACDVVDGWLARRLSAATAAGAALDWSGDVALAYGSAWRFLPHTEAIIASSILVVLQVLSLCGRTPHRSSGRALLTGAILLELARR